MERRTLYPPLEPYRTGTIKVSEIHTMFYQEAGNPEGKPALFLHGGPGVGILPDYRRFFDPKFYRVILPDQRGAARSTPYAELKENTTWDIVEDLEKLRKHLNIERWIVMGGSWGSTLGLKLRNPSSAERCRIDFARDLPGATNGSRLVVPPGWSFSNISR